MRHIGYYHSVCGIIQIIEENRSIVSLDFVDTFGEENVNAVVLQCKKELEEYFLGKRKEFDVDIFLSGTDFQISVWNELRSISYGEVISYKELAIKMGNVKLVRAVANAIGKNPILIIIPCHRVIGTNGNLTGYRGGLDRKNILLKLEQN